MKAIRLLLLLSLCCLWPSCKPSPTFELTQAFIDTKWELLDLDAGYHYVIVETYTLDNGSFRKITQEGRVEMTYNADPGIWSSAYEYTREQETSAGVEPSLFVKQDTTYTDLSAIWEFRVDEANTPAGFIQSYLDQSQNCEEIFKRAGEWEVFESKDFDVGKPSANLKMELGHLFENDFAGGLVFYPRVFNRNGFVPITTSVAFDKNSIGLLSRTNNPDLEFRTTSFEDPSYGHVVVEETYRLDYISASLIKLEEDPCEPQVVECGPGSITCINGSVVEDVEGVCICQCEASWEGPACDRKLLLAAWVGLEAGDGTEAYLDTTALNAQFHRPFDLAADAAGNIFIADWKNDAIRKFDRSSGEVTTYAGGNGIGHQDGAAANAQFRGPTALTITPDGTMYICDKANHVIRQITPNGTVSTLLGTVGTSGHQPGSFATARIMSPRDIIYDAEILRGHPVLLVSEAGNSVIWLMDLQTQECSVYAGSAGGGGHVDGPGLQAYFASPSGMALAADGTLYVADRGNFAIRAIANNAERTVSTYAGDRPQGGTIVVPANRPYAFPSDVVFGPDSALYVADERNHRIRRIRLLNGVPFDEAVAGDQENNQAGYVEGHPTTARFDEPVSLIFIDKDLYVSELGNSRIRSIYFQ